MAVVAFGQIGEQRPLKFAEFFLAFCRFTQISAAKATDQKGYGCTEATVDSHGKVKVVAVDLETDHQAEHGKGAIKAIGDQVTAGNAPGLIELQKKAVAFKVCNLALTNFEIQPEDLIPGCEIVPAGIVTLIELQNEGYAYIKP